MPSADLLVRPQFLWVPDHVSSAADELVGLLTMLGMPPDVEQQMALEAILAEKPRNADELIWAALLAVLVAPRQNVKTYLFRALALGALFLWDVPLTVWTAHAFDVTMESFRELKETIQSHPDLDRRVQRISEANGAEGIELRRMPDGSPGPRIRFKARTKTGARGLAADLVLLDEGFALQKSHMGSLMPTLSAKSMLGNPLLVVASSSGMLSSDVLREMRDRGRAGGDMLLAYIEWCASPGQCADPECTHIYGVEGCQLDDETKWAEANLALEQMGALNRRISLDFVRNERRTLDPIEFARERMGWWDDPPAADGEWTTFDADDWETCRKPDSVATRDVRYALDLDTNLMGQEWCSIAASDGEHLELVQPEDAPPGTAWVVPELERQKAVIGELLIDAAGPAARLLAPLKKAGIKVQKVTASEVTQACMLLVDLVKQHRARHLGQAQLDTAAAKVATREIGKEGAERFSRTLSPVDASPVMAAALAAWGAQAEQPQFFGAWR